MDNPRAYLEITHNAHEKTPRVFLGFIFLDGPTDNRTVVEINYRIRAIKEDVYKEDRMEAIGMRIGERMMRFEPVNTIAGTGHINGREAIKVIKDSKIAEFDEPTFARMIDADFRDGIIEVDVLSKLLNDAPDFARGFIGVAFRIDERNSQFESIYIRPTNGRADDQVRRNRSIQYFSYPEYKFDRLRIETPGRYETYADMGLNEWIHMKIVVEGNSAFLHLNGSPHPVLVVYDLKHGVGLSGGIGLWVDVGTEGYFSDIRITHR